MILITIKEIKYINKEIQRLRSKLARLESEVYNVTPKLNDAPFGGGSGDKIGAAVSQIADIKLDIQVLELKRDTALNMLNRDKFEENCLYMRLKCGYSWAKIATITGSTIDSVKKICYKYHW